LYHYDILVIICLHSNRWKYHVITTPMTMSKNLSSKKGTFLELISSCIMCKYVTATTVCYTVPKVAVWWQCVDELKTSMKFSSALVSSLEEWVVGPGTLRGLRIGCLRTCVLRTSLVGQCYYVEHLLLPMYGKSDKTLNQ